MITLPTLPTLIVTPITQRPALTPTVQLPAAGWEITLPPGVIAPAGLRQLSLTDQGIYLEASNGHWDYIPYAELASLLEYAPDATVALAPMPQPHINGNGRVTR